MASPSLGDLSRSNPFDPNRKLWPDRTPPPPPPPVPAPVTDADLEVYGVVMAGGAQKALLKLGTRFAGVPVGPTGIAVVPVGAQLGEFVLTQVTPDQILLKAPGGEQWIRFSLKKDRAAGARMAQQAPVAAPAPVQAAGFGTPAGAPFSAPFAAPASSASSAPATMLGGVAASSGANTAAPPPTGVPIVPTGSGATGGQMDASPAAPPAGSLAAAIMAAQAAQKAAAEGGGAAPAPGINPFEALLQQQKK